MSRTAVKKTNHMYSKYKDSIELPALQGAMKTNAGSIFLLMQRRSKRQICSPCGNKVLCLASMGFTSSVWLGLGIDNFPLSLSLSLILGCIVLVLLWNCKTCVDRRCINQYTQYACCSLSM